MLFFKVICSDRDFCNLWHWDCKRIIKAILSDTELNRKFPALFVTEDKAMLVLSRKSGESIHIGDGIVVMITEIRGGRVKVGISAPDSFVIRRGELQDWNADIAAPAIPVARKLAADQFAANDRRAAATSSPSPKTTDKRPAAASRSVGEHKVATNRVRLAMELPKTQCVTH
jgi:carbon storage regulator